MLTCVLIYDGMPPTKNTFIISNTRILFCFVCATAFSCFLFFCFLLIRFGILLNSISRVSVTTISFGLRDGAVTHKILQLCRSAAIPLRPTAHMRQLQSNERSLKSCKLYYCSNNSLFVLCNSLPC